ncbi:hypothetical protein KEM54_000587 [Ascosphaera aggregata]|nr:hypothetical protein KEM54_000587 [Ascosphaera aggregata]
MTISTQMWLRMKPLIERLYRDEELHLKLVLPRVRREGFNPTEAQLRNKLKKWGIRKPNRKPRASSKKSSQTEVVKVSESHQHRALRPKPPGVLGEPCAQWIHTPAAGPAPRIDSYSTEPAYQTVKTSYPTPASHVFSGAPSQGDVSRFNDVSVTHPVLQTYTDLPVLSLDDLAVTSSSPGTLSPKTAPCLSGVNTPYPTLQNLEGAQSTSLGGVINTNDNRICSRQS